MFTAPEGQGRIGSTLCPHFNAYAMYCITQIESAEVGRARNVEQH